MSASGRVLVVEDEVLIRMLAVDMLEEFGHDVEEAGNAATALEKLRASATGFSIVFMDIGLPDMHGDDLVREIRSFGPDIPLLIASGEEQTELARRLSEFEPIGFLGKPYDMVRLKQALEALRSKTA